MSFHHLIWILATLALQGSCSIEKDRVITIDKFGIGSVECCTYGHCHCSKLALALEHIQSNTEIRILSSISLHGVPQFETVNDTNITILGNNNPTVKCDHQGGLVGRNVGHVVIQGVTWDGCNEGIKTYKFINIRISECNFQNTEVTLRGHGSIYINKSTFLNTNNGGVNITYDGHRTSAASTTTVYDSAFNHANLAIAINNDYNIGFDHDVINVAISNSSFSTYSYSVDCKGNHNLLPTVWIASSNFTNNLDSAVNAEYCNIVLKKNCSFFDNSMSVIYIRYGTVNMTGPIVFRNNTVHLHTSSPKVNSYGGAISLRSSNMSVIEGPIKFYSNAADYGEQYTFAKAAEFIQM